MEEIINKMLEQSMKALMNSDANLARQVTKWDYDIDGLYVKFRTKLLKIIIERPEIDQQRNGSDHGEPATGKDRRSHLQYL